MKHIIIVDELNIIFIINVFFLNLFFIPKKNKRFNFILGFFFVKENEHNNTIDPTQFFFLKKLVNLPFYKLKLLTTKQNSFDKVDGV